MSHFDFRLPVLQPDQEADEAPSCSPTSFVSNEELALLSAMRALRERSNEVKRGLDAAGDNIRPKLEAELESLRTEWKDLARRREEAFVRKMIMLGHLPPDHAVRR